MNTDIDVTKHFTLCGNEKNYYAHPSMKRLANGDILVGFRQSVCRYPESFSHIDPTARAVLMRSGDEGETWSNPVLLDIDLPANGTLGDVMLTTLPDGRVLAGLFCWRVYEKDEKEPSGRPTIPVPNYPEKWHAAIDPPFFAVSDDNGHSWRKSGNLGDCGGAIRSDVIVLEDGNLLSPAYQVTDSNGAFNKVCKTRLFVSADGAETWSDYGEFLKPLFYCSFDETFIYKADSGDLTAFARAGRRKDLSYENDFDFSKIRCLNVSHSQDNGKNWSEVMSFPEILGYPFHAHTLPSGNVLLSYGRRKDPLSIRCFVLDSSCSNIDPAREKILVDGLPHNDLGYTSAVNLKDGKILLIYYTNSGKNASIKGIILEEKEADA